MQQQLFELASTKYFGIYRGQVINNVDPDGAGKIQVAIGPMFLGIASITPANLPWAFPAQPVSFGAGVNYGTLNIPNVKSWVYCFFLEGDVYQPHYCFDAPTLTQGVPSNVSPTIRGWTSPSGMQFSVDDSQGVVTIASRNGAIIRVDNTGTVTLIAPDRVYVQAPQMDVSGNVNAGSGATGSFGSSDGSLITVSNGIITEIG